MPRVKPTGNTGEIKTAGVKAAEAFPRETQTVDLERNQQEARSGYLQAVYAHVVPGAHPWQFLLLQTKIHITCLSHAHARLSAEADRLKKHTLTPSDKGESSWRQLMLPRRIKGGRVGQNQHGESRCENILLEALWFGFCASHRHLFITAATADGD